MRSGLRLANCPSTSASLSKPLGRRSARKRSQWKRAQAPGLIHPRRRSTGYCSQGIEDLAYARRIAQLRDYYFDHAPELAGYLPNPAEPLPTPGLGIRLWQQFLTVAGMVAVITAVLAGSAGGLLAAVVSGHSLVAALASGVVVAAAALTGLMRYQNSAWLRGTTASLFPGAEAGPH